MAWLPNRCFASAGSRSRRSSRCDRRARSRDQLIIERSANSVTTFGLIHGGFHTSWCWGELRHELERRSHRVLTVDLPVSDTTADPDAYLDAAASAFGSAPEPVVVVGHSIAGWTAMRLPEVIPVEGIIYLCSCINMPPGVYDDEPLPMISADPADWTPDETGLITMTADAARQYFYHDVASRAGRRCHLASGASSGARRGRTSVSAANPFRSGGLHPGFGRSGRLWSVVDVGGHTVDR